MRAKILAKVKLWGEMAVALTAVAAVFAAIIGAFGGHFPPYATYAWAMSQEELSAQNARGIAALQAIVISDKIGDIQAALYAHPEDRNLHASLLYWQQQLTAAQNAALPPRYTRKPAR